RWEFAVNSEVISAPALSDDGVLYVTVEAGLVYAIEAASGKKLWSQKVGQSTSSPALSTEGRLFIMDRIGGRLVCLERLTGRQLWAKSGGANSFTSPVVGP